MEQIVLNVKELQEALGIGRDGAYALMRNNAFPSMRIGSRYVVDKRAFEEWLEKYRYKQFIL